LLKKSGVWTESWRNFSPTFDRVVLYFYDEMGKYTHHSVNTDSD